MFKTNLKIEVVPVSDKFLVKNTLTYKILGFVYRKQIYFLSAQNGYIYEAKNYNRLIDICLISSEKEAEKLKKLHEDLIIATKGI